MTANRYRSNQRNGKTSGHEEDHCYDAYYHYEKIVRGEHYDWREDNERDYDGDYRERGRQGFASMDTEEVRRIASMGGRAARGQRRKSIFGTSGRSIDKIS